MLTSKSPIMNLEKMQASIFHISLGTIASLSLYASTALAQQMSPKIENGGCPNGAGYAGSGYCRSIPSTKVQFFPKVGNGGCPNGSGYAGGGACKTYR